jgi:hypothetical protein
MKHFNFLLLTVFILTSCATQRGTNTIVSCEYDKTKNQTDYMVFPYGSVSIPDKWERTTYNSVARQQFFTNSDSIIIAVAFSPSNKYEFNQDNSKKGFDFAQAFYEWDSEYFVNNFKLNREVIETDSISGYIIWRVYGENNNTLWDTYFLFGEKNGFVQNFSVMKTDKWTTEQKVTFLKKLYTEK